ncbi:MAG: NADH-quinone oxidoreductase subunit C [Actinomycetota bacterium]
MGVLERVYGDSALDRVKAELGDRVIEARTNFDQVDLVVAPEFLVEVVTRLRDAEGIACRFFTFLSGVDRTLYGDEEHRPEKPYEVLIHLYSPDYALHVNIHVPMAADDLVCPSISGVFGGALWHERECHEMFGFDFPGHPGLVNLYLPEDFEGHPLRKDFHLATRVVKPWPGAKDPDEAAGGKR